MKNETVSLQEEQIKQNINPENVRLKNKNLTLISMLVSLILLMSFTPLGYLKTFGVSISLLGIPVGIGAITLGKNAGGILGLTFGLTSFYQCLIGSPFGATLLSINPFATFLVCVPTRFLMGYLTGLVFEILEQRININTKTKYKFASYYITGFISALLNTIFFMTTLVLCFWSSDYIQSLSTNLGSTNPFIFIILFVGVNGLIEIPANCFVVGQVSKVLKKVLK